jgi:DNA-binding Lrp family transcriptional regulator
MARLDEIDKRILRALQRDGRLQNVELAREVGLSPSPCLRRVRRLEEEGVIDRYVAVLDPSKVGVRHSLSVADFDDYRRFQSTHLTRTNGIQNVKTDVPSQVVKQTRALPLR